MSRPAVLLFDLGGVIVRWVGIAELARLTNLSETAVKRRFASSDIFNAYETGLCDNGAFCSEMVKLFELDMTDQAFGRLWNSWVQDVYPGTDDMLNRLRATYRVACLSNTNHLHWEHLKGYFNCEERFDPALASHQIHLAKPDPTCFEDVIRRLNTPPSDIWFFDDTQANVDAAQKAGMTAFKVDPAVGVIPVIQSLAL